MKTADNKQSVDMMVPNDTSQGLIQSSTQYQKVYVSHGTKCMLIVMGTITSTLLITQFVFFFTGNIALITSGAWMSIATAINAAIFSYGLLFYPGSTEINVNKSTNMIEVTYKMIGCGKDLKRVEALDNISEIEIKPVKSQYGIVGYVANILFKNGAKKI